MRAVLAILLLAAAPQDDAKAVVDTLDKALGDFQDGELSVTTSRGRFFIDMASMGPARLRIRRDGDAALDCLVRDGAMLQSRVTYSMKATADGFFFEIAPYWADALTLAAPAYVRARAPLETPDGIDPLLLPTCYPIRFFMDDSLLFYALAPKRYLALEKGLAVHEKRADGTTVLVAKTTVKDAIKAIGIPFVAAGAIEKRFFIRNDRLDRVTMRIDLGKSGYSAMIVADVLARNDRGLPIRTSMRLQTLLMGRPQHFDPVERVIEWTAVNKGVKIETPPVDDRTWADAALRPLAAYAKKDDAASLASVAAIRMWMKPMIRSIFQVDTGEAGADKAVETLEKLREIHPKDEAVAFNLLTLQPGEKAEKLLADDAVAGRLWTILRTVRGKPFSPEALTALCDAVGTKAETLGINDWMPIVRAFGGEPFMAWAKASGPAALRAHLALGAQGTARLDWIASAVKADPKDPDVRRCAVDIICAVFQAGIVANSDDGRSVLAVADTLGDPLVDGWRSIAEGKADASRFKDAKPGSAAQERLLALGLATVGEHAKANEAALKAAARGEIDSLFGADSPVVVGTTTFRATKDVVAFGRILECYASAGPWAVQAGLRDPDAANDFLGAAVEWAGKNPKETATLVVLARASYAAGGDLRYGAKFLETAVASGADDPAILGLLASATRTEDRVFELLSKIVGAGSPVSRILRAADIANRKGEKEKARAFLKFLGPLSQAQQLEDAAQVCAAAGEHDKALAYARALEDHARRPFTLLGHLAEAREDYEDAFRWYGRDAREGGDPLETYTWISDDFGRSMTWRGKISAGDARKKLIAKLGPDWLVKRLLERKLEPLPPEQEKAAKEAFEALKSDDLAARDDAEETLLKLGPRVAPILKPGLESSDADVKSRVTRVLQKLAEP